MLIPRPLFSSNYSFARSSGSHEILVISNPIHTDIAIKVTDETLSRFGSLLLAGVPLDHPAARWIVFGWGGRSFYLETPTWSELKAAPVLRALTVDQAVMHVDVAGDIDLSNPAVKRIMLGTEGFESLLEGIAASFTYSDDMPVAIHGASYGPTDRFFEARGYFNAFLGCNTWTALMLRKAGVKTGLWNPLPFSLSVSLDLFN